MNDQTTQIDNPNTTITTADNRKIDIQTNAEGRPIAQVRKTPETNPIMEAQWKEIRAAALNLVELRKKQVGRALWSAADIEAVDLVATSVFRLGVVSSPMHEVEGGTVAPGQGISAAIEALNNQGN